MSDVPSRTLALRVAEALRRSPRTWRRVARGWTRAERWIVQLDDDSTAFIKAAGNELTAKWLRLEHRVYSALRGDFLPKSLAWSDDGRQPFLVLEDLSLASWPPPWNQDQVQRVLDALGQVHRSHIDLPFARLIEQRDQLMGWRRIARDPDPFLRLGLCTPRWLHRALPALLAAEAEAELDGNDFVHGDIKSDNICLRNGQPLFIDWNWACRGNGLIDVAGWLPGLHDEGGPQPHTLLPGQGAMATLLCGYFASRAPEPPPAQVPTLRSTQLMKVLRLLPWICRELHLPSVEQA